MATRKKKAPKKARVRTEDPRPTLDECLGQATPISSEPRLSESQKLAAELDDLNSSINHHRGSIKYHEKEVKVHGEYLTAALLAHAETQAKLLKAVETPSVVA